MLILIGPELEYLLHAAGGEFKKFFTGGNLELIPPQGEIQNDIAMRDADALQNAGADRRIRQKAVVTPSHFTADGGGQG